MEKEKTTKYYSTTSRITKTKKTDSIKSWEGCRTKGKLTLLVGV